MSTFFGAQLKIKRAVHHIKDLNTKVAQIAASSLYKVTIQPDPNTADDLLKVEVVQVPTDDLSPIIGDALHNLKAALDVTVNEIVYRRLGRYDDFTRFPVRETREAVINAVNGGLIKKASKPVADFIVDVVKPYAGGNDAIWHLHNLNILDKHRLLLPVFELTLVSGICVEDERGVPHTADTFLMRGHPISESRIVGCRNGKIANKGDASVLVLFGHGLPLDGHPLITTLYEFAQMVTGILVDIERVFLTESTSLGLAI